MVKIQKISEIEPRLGFTEFDMLKKYRQSFATSELGVSGFSWLVSFLLSV